MLSIFYYYNSKYFINFLIFLQQLTNNDLSHSLIKQDKKYDAPFKHKILIFYFKLLILSLLFIYNLLIF